MTMYGEDAGIKKYIVLPMRSCPTCKNKVIDFLKANVDALAVQRDLSIIVIEMPANARNLKIELGNQLMKIVHFDFTNNTDSIFESPCLILGSGQSNFDYIDLAQVDIQKYKDALISK